MSRNAATRRSVIAASLCLVANSGWAAEEPTSGDIRIPLADGDFAGFRAQPAQGGPVPCVLVAGETAGIQEWTADCCRRLAQAGYLAVAPDLWGGDQERSDDDVVRRLDAASAWAGKNGGDLGRTGIAGFGRGGRVTWLYAAQGGWLKAAVVWGGGVGARSGAQSKTPLEVAKQLRAPLLGLFGKNDESNPRALLLRAESEAHAAGRQVELVVYSGAAAEFAVEGRPTYDKVAALDGWVRMLDWFKRFGVV